MVDVELKLVAGLVAQVALEFFIGLALAGQVRQVDFGWTSLAVEVV